MTFDELFHEFNLTPDERKALVLRLAHLRYEKTVEALLPDLRLKSPYSAIEAPEAPEHPPTP